MPHTGKLFVSLGHSLDYYIFRNPNPEDSPVLSDIKWQTVAAHNSKSLSNTDVALLNITGSYQTGPKFNITVGFYPERIQFWETVLDG